MSRRKQPHIDFLFWLAMIALLAFCFSVNTCSGQCASGQCSGGQCPTQQQFRGLAIGGWRASGLMVPVPRPQPPSQSVGQLQPSTVRVTHESDDGRATHGTGSVIAVDDSRGQRLGLVITCAHIMRHDWRPFVIANGRKTPATVLGVNPAYDLMALETSVSRPTHLMPLAADHATPGQGVRWEGATVNGPEVSTGPVVGYKKVILLARGRTANGQSGGPIYDSRGLQGVVTSSDDSADEWRTEGPCALYIRGWLKECCDVTITGDTYTVGERITEPYADENGILPKWKEMYPGVVLPGPADKDEPTVDVDDDTPPDIDIPVPDVDTETPDEVDIDVPDEAGKPDKWTITIQELVNAVSITTESVNKLTVNVQQTTTNIDKLTTRVEALELLLDPDNLDKLKGEKGEPFADNGPITFQLQDKDGKVIQEYKGGFARFAGEVVPIQLVPVKPVQKGK